jgi:hypothetical protein
MEPGVGAGGGLTPLSGPGGGGVSGGGGGDTVLSFVATRVSPFSGDRSMVMGPLSAHATAMIAAAAIMIVVIRDCTVDTCCS